MAANQYNFTKQNNVVMKARKRFTKQNGVVKQILAGWTKRNGVVEQVYASAAVPQFATFITKELTTRVYALSANDAVLYRYNGGSDNHIFVQNDFWSEGPIVAVSCKLLLNHISYNYAENSLIGSDTYGEKELLLSDPYNPVAYSRYGGVISAPIKIGDINYIGYYNQFNSSTKQYDTVKLVEYSATAKTVGETLTPGVDYQSRATFSAGLCLYEGRGVCVASHITLESSDPHAYTFVLYDYDHSASNKVSYTTVASIDNAVAFEGGMSPGVFTTNGQDCFFTVSWSGLSYEDDASYLCKYNIQTKTLTKVALNHASTIVGTYNGFVYVLASSENDDEFLVVKKYNLSLELVGTHAIPAQPGKSRTQPFNTTVNSNSRYVAFGGLADTWYCVLDLELF